MRNLLIFITKYNAFFLFLIFEIASLIIYIKYNSFQKASFINSTNRVSSSLYARADEFKGYLSLKEVNDGLAKENAALRNQLRSYKYADTLAKRTVNDTIYKQQYVTVEAKVINNSINKRNNYLTISRGTKDGIAKGMGVISDAGVVGKVVFVGEHLAIVQSLLHKDSRFSAMLATNKEIGYLEWGEDMDPHKGLLIDVSNNAQPKIGEAVVTSDLSLFPAGVPLGKVSKLNAKKGGGFFLNMEVALATDFSKLEYVYVVINKFAQEQNTLEAQEKKADE
ncbi:rod shape-determining protein MreC [Mucilaginibacter phyllosphaerae]|uniref:Cell shape-determining protein MreC n=1 Tax=Mucilaginibacter phyllosphaerae TaxID=1812349 RepID=A0A4Y8AJZ5_9SPHI|nr:rod shape-determining protein MreC [Mucilaginibacter phyllosphaerae]MBB3967616.1 rod shape-determining protein MreC [Mucilaginibacter phyllosphaerae]TEW69327.1 rod shape-determining protein MreC [Mucilaginibacter phyllosphaerae]GGH21724.1 cell shape-determining protein MreC [Mucilaginibacter phyllosphaerae]